MRPYSEQFSEVRNSQVTAQFEFIRTFTGKAFESAEKIIALNFEASRASLEKSSAAMRQLIASQDPRDLLALTSGSQAHFESMLAYSRKLFDIAAGVPPAARAIAPAKVPAKVFVNPPADVPVNAPAAPESVSEPMPAASETPPTPARAKPARKAAVARKAAAAPSAKAKPAAKPAALPHPSAASFPTASSMKASAVVPLKPVDAAPPHAPVSGTAEVVAKQAATTAVKQARKK